MSTSNTVRSEKVSRVFAALADGTRLDILNLLMEYPDICVSGIADELSISVSAVSQQCKLLELSGLVIRNRQGQKICYSVKHEDPMVESLLNIIKKGE